MTCKDGGDVYAKRAYLAVSVPGNFELVIVCSLRFLC